MDFVKREQDEDQQPFLPTAGEDVSLSDHGSRKSTSTLKGVLRLILEMVMAMVILVLLVRPFPDIRTTKASPVPACMVLARDLKCNQQVPC
jgi:hypothetical protein